MSQNSQNIIQLDPIFAINYAPSGTGKSTDTIYAFNDKAIYIGEKNAIKAPARSVVGVEIPDDQVIVADTLDDVSKYVEMNHERLKARGILAIAVDDFSLVVQNTFDMVQSPAPKGKGLSGFKIFSYLIESLHRFRRACRRALVHVVVNAHEGQKHLNVQSGQWVLGGPKIPGQMQGDIGQAFDVVLRVRMDPTRAVGYRAMFECGVDPDFITKDRNNVVDGRCPFNTAEVFRAAGYTLPRARGLEWIEPMVQQFSDYLLQLASQGFNIGEASVMKQIGPQFRQQIAQHTKDERHVNWVLRDAYDRAIIKQMLASRRQLGF